MQAEVEQLLSFIEQKPYESRELANAYNRLAFLHLDSQPEKALEFAVNAHRTAIAVAHEEASATALLYAGMSCSSQRKFNDARKFYKEALALQEKTGNREATATLHAKLGNTQLHDGEYAQALAHYEKAIELRTTINDRMGVADLYTNSGIIYGLQGSHTLALKSHLLALKTYEELNEETRIASSSANIGLIYMGQKNYDDALKMYEKALSIRRHVNDRKGISDMMVNIGNVYHAQEKYKEALEMQMRALQLRKDMGDELKMASSYSNIGNSLKTSGNYAEALDNYFLSLHLFTKQNDRRGIVQSNVNLGELYFELKDNRQAHEYLSKAIKMGEETGLKNLVRKAYEYQSQLFAEERKFEEAFVTYQNYNKLDKEISNTETSQQIAQMSLRYEIEQKERDAEAERVKNAELTKAYSSLETEKRRSDELLNNILPEEVSEELKRFGKTKARSFEMASVMFADIQGFTRISEQLSAEEIVSGIDEYFEAFDKIVEAIGLEKIKTIGDAYLCAGGIPVPDEQHALKTATAAIEFLKVSELLRSKRLAEGKRAFDFRIGIHSGKIVAGVVGIKKFAYDIWGDTVNTASRLQTSSEPNQINISEATYNLISQDFECEYRGEIEVKNKAPMKMYFISQKGK